MEPSAAGVKQDALETPPQDAFAHLARWMLAWPRGVDQMLNAEFKMESHDATVHQPSPMETQTLAVQVDLEVRKHLNPFFYVNLAVIW